MQHICAILFHFIYPDFLHYQFQTNLQFCFKMIICHIHAMFPLADVCVCVCNISYTLVLLQKHQKPKNTKKIFFDSYYFKVT